MEDDIDIYADLPSFNLDPNKNDQPCNCEKLKKELSSLESKYENIQKIKDNLEKNLSSLLKTARAEIARKDKMISDLRKRLDDATFRRNNKGESRDFSANRSSHQHHTTVEKYENASLMHLQEDVEETVFHETEFYYNEHKSKKPQYDSQLPTIFAERLHKRIIKDEKEDAKQKTSLKFDIEANSKRIPEENIVESDKENGSQSNINNNSNESNIIAHFDSENPCRKNSGKRMNEEDDTCESKRLKIDDSKGKTATNEIDYCTVQYELKDDLVQYEMKDDLAKLEDRLNSIKEEEISLDKRKAALEYQDTVKQNRDYTSDWKREDKSSSRIASTSNHVLEEPNYKKNDYRHNPSRRSYSRSRSDYESSSGHRLRERSNRTYRNSRKYDDYKYDNQYRTKRDYRLKRDYESMENESNTRHRSRERGNAAWDKSRYSSNDVENKEGNSSYKNKKYESRRIKETVNVLHNKNLHERDKAVAEMDFRASSSRTIVNNKVNYGAKKTNEQDNKIKIESNVKSINSIESTSTYVATQDSSNLEEGEIEDSFEKKIDSTKISEDHKMIENDIKIEDKSKDVPAISFVTDDKSILFQNDVITAKQLDNATDISKKEVKEASCLVQTTLTDPGEIAELDCSGKNDAVVNEVQNHNNITDICESKSTENLTNSITCTIGTIEQMCESQCNKDLTDSTTYTIGAINQVCDNNVDDNDKSSMEEESKTSVIETIIKTEKLTDSNTESAIKVERMDDSNDKVSNSNIEGPIIIAETNNSTCKVNDEELTNVTVEAAVKIEPVLQCDIENGDVSQVSIGSETPRRTSDKNNVEISHLCLSDHNYVQDPPSVNVPDSDIVRESAASPGHCESIPATLKETKAEEKTNVSLTIGTKKTMPTTVKNKKNQQSQGIVISRRRRAVTLSDSNASMTVLMNTKTCSNIISSSSNESVLKPRACKASRACK